MLAIHIDQTARYGGDNSIRDIQLLESALAQPSLALDRVTDIFMPFHLVWPLLTGPANEK